MKDTRDLRSGPASGPDRRSLTPQNDIYSDLPGIHRAAAAGARMAGASPEDAQDIAQDIILLLYTAAENGGELPRSPYAWARLVAQRQVSALRRRRSPELLTPFDSLGALYAMARLPQKADDGGLGDLAERERVLSWLSRLPQEQRAVLALSVDGFPLEDIARYLKIPPSLARTRLRAARESVRITIVGQMEEDRQAEAAGQTSASSSREDSAVVALPPRQQEVLRLSREGYKPAQIARVLAVSPNTVRVNLFHARKRLRQRAGAA